MKLSKEIDGWLIVLVVVVTAFITSWAMLKYKPSNDWNASYYPPQQVAQNFSPGIAAMQRGGLLAAAVTEIPVIRAGAVAPHTDRGVCIDCHRVMSSRQKPIPPISANATMPHEFRGVCSNCHRLPNQGGLNTNPYCTQAATRMAAVGPVATPGTVMPVRTATEGEWMGMEVAPITPLTARQYGISNGTRGLVVAEAEGQATMVGIKAGDLVVSVNGAPITQMVDFLQATRNGTLTHGVVEVVRQGRRLAVNIAPATSGPLSITPANGAAWGGGQGMGGIGAGNRGAACQRQF
ncbi:MAG: magnetochrome domain-containing protein [Planctomycetota bacterium]